LIFILQILALGLTLRTNILGFMDIY